MLIKSLGCGFQNEATITASIQMLLDLTLYARRELPFQVPANQMDGIPTVHMSYFLRSGEGPTAQSFGAFHVPNNQAVKPISKVF
jgi:hypothetical protein